MSTSRSLWCGRLEGFVFIASIAMLPTAGFAERQDSVIRYGDYRSDRWGYSGQHGPSGTFGRGEMRGRGPFGTRSGPAVGAAMSVANSHSS